MHIYIYIVYLPIVKHLGLMQINGTASGGAAGAVVGGRRRVMVGSGDQSGAHRRAMLVLAAARIVFVQVVGECVPAAAHADHDVRTKDLVWDSPKKCYLFFY